MKVLKQKLLINNGKKGSNRKNDKYKIYMFAKGCIPNFCKNYNIEYINIVYI
jgi:hypothetical protein